MADPADIDNLAALIRSVDGNHQLGASALAEHLIAAGVRVHDAGEETANQRLAAVQGARVAKKLKDQAQRLRGIADELSRLAGNALDLSMGVSTQGSPSYAAIAQDAQAAVLQRGVANLDLSGLTTIAADADEYRVTAHMFSAPKEY